MFQESGKAPHAPFSAEQVTAAGLAHAMLGHYHAPKDGEHHTYPGNPDPLSFGESGVRGAVLLDFADSGALTRTRLSVASTVVQDVAVNLAGPTNAQEVRDQVSAALAPLTGIVRVTLSGEVGPGLDLQLGDLKDLGPHLARCGPRQLRLRRACRREDRSRTVRQRCLGVGQAGRRRQTAGAGYRAAGP
jgi:DNA repair exonuclease SbcCD nuclease subunit